MKSIATLKKTIQDLASMSTNSDVQELYELSLIPVTAENIDELMIAVEDIATEVSLETVIDGTSLFLLCRDYYKALKKELYNANR